MSSYQDIAFAAFLTQTCRGAAEVHGSSSLWVGQAIARVSRQARDNTSLSSYSCRVLGIAFAGAQLAYPVWIGESILSSLSTSLTRALGNVIKEQATPARHRKQASSETSDNSSNVIGSSVIGSDTSSTVIGSTVIGSDTSSNVIRKHSHRPSGSDSSTVIRKHSHQEANQHSHRKQRHQEATPAQSS